MSESKSNLNTILLTIALGLLGWLGYTTHLTAISVAVAVEKNGDHTRDILDLRTRVAALEIELAKLKR